MVAVTFDGIECIGYFNPSWWRGGHMYEGALCKRGSHEVEFFHMWKQTLKFRLESSKPLYSQVRKVRPRKFERPPKRVSAHKVFFYLVKQKFKF